MITLREFFDRCSVLRKERQREIARVVNSGGRKVDLFAGFWLTTIDLQLVETSRWNFDSVDEECTFVTVDEVDAYLGLTENFLVVGG